MQYCCEAVPMKSLCEVVLSTRGHKLLARHVRGRHSVSSGACGATSLWQVSCLRTFVLFLSTLIFSLSLSSLSLSLLPLSSSLPHCLSFLSVSPPLSIFSLFVNLHVHFTPAQCVPAYMHFVTDAPTHPRWLVSCHKTEFHLTWSRSAEKRQHGWNRSQALVIPRQQQQFEQFQNREQKWSLLQTWYQQQLRGLVAQIRQQVSAELNETVSGRIDMLININTALRNVTVKPALRAIPNLQHLSEVLGRQRRQGRIPTFHVGPALVDTSAVR